MLPFQSVQLIEEYQRKPEVSDQKTGKVIPFSTQKEQDDE
jgi:hypothetical protein